MRFCLTMKQMRSHEVSCNIIPIHRMTDILHNRMTLLTSFIKCKDIKFLFIRCQCYLEVYEANYCNDNAIWVKVYLFCLLDLNSSLFFYQNNSNLTKSKNIAIDSALQRPGRTSDLNTIWSDVMQLYLAGHLYLIELYRLKLNGNKVQWGFFLSIRSNIILYINP